MTNKGQWYPGSMARALNVLRQDLKVIDLVVELLDARIPFSSRNPALKEVLEGKKHLVLLHKADRAEESITEKWLNYFKDMDQTAMSFSVHNKKYLKSFLRFIKQHEKNLRPGRIKRPLRMMFVGIPNVGKSTLINHFVHKAVTRTGNQPGVTRGRQWIKITPGLELLDTPGILWPKITEYSTWPLAVVGAMPPSRLDQQGIALWLLDIYKKKEKTDLLIKRYGNLDCTSVEFILKQIGASHGCLKSAGEVDLERTSGLVLRDFQAGSLGRLTLEEPAEFIVDR
ncbi:MAG: ribosome biogenesis GTPase YlqF [Bacillota bacterium]